jgi:hypothetical protein
MFDGPRDDGLPQVPGFEVRRVPGFRATKDYVCPDCGNAIAAGLGHVVAWPEGVVDDRRHWHLHCWRQAAGRRRAW